MLRRIKYDMLRGNAEGFPSCCVLFYSLFWVRFSDLSQLSQIALKVWLKLIENPYHRMMNSNNIQWGRIACPKCLVKDKLGLP